MENEMESIERECQLKLLLREEAVPNWDASSYGPEAVLRSIEEARRTCPEFQETEHVVECSQFPCVLMVRGEPPAGEPLCGTSELPLNSASILEIGDEKFWVASISPQELLAEAEAEVGRRIRDLTLLDAWKARSE